jgi:hypothetical protein
VDAVWFLIWVALLVYVTAELVRRLMNKEPVAKSIKTWLRRFVDVFFSG